MKTTNKRITAAAAALLICTGILGTGTPAAAYLRGDAVRDGTVSIEDAQITLSAYADITAGKTNPLKTNDSRRADADGDGKITAADAQLILLYYTANTVAQMPTAWRSLMPKPMQPGISDTGKKLTIGCYTNDDLSIMVEQFTEQHPEYKDQVEYVKVGDFASDASDRLASLLDSGADLDLYVMEAEYLRNYINDADYSAPLSELGFTDQDFAACYPYTLSLGKDREGVLKAAAWQVHPGGYVYRSDLAEQYFGVKTPAEMQEYVKDWDKFRDTAKQIQGKSDGKTAMLATVSGILEAWKQYPVGVKRSADNQLTVDNDLKQVADVMRSFYVNGYTTTEYQWTDGWYGVGQNDEAFGYFFSSWCVGGKAMLYYAEGGEDGTTYGKYNITEGPCPWFWGGYWMLLSPGCDNKTIAHDFIYDFVVNPETMKEFSARFKKAYGMPAFLNNMTLMSQQNEANPLLGGQSEFAVLHNNIKNMDIGKIYQDTDYALTRDALSYFESYYVRGTMSYDETVQYIKDTFKGEYPEYTIK